MRLPKWLRGQPKPLEQHPELPAPAGPLREFVYLDEVSVISLIASRRGAVPAAVTRSESARETAEISSKLAASAAVAKGEFGSKLASESTGSVTTVAKSVVQTTFRDLRAIEEKELLLRVPLPSQPPSVSADSDLLRLATTDDGAGWVLEAGQLKRGTPFEAEVELETDPLFRGSTVISEILSLMGDASEVVPDVPAREIAEMRQINDVLERLLAGLVPLRGRLVDYRLVDVRGRELIVHRRLLEGLDLESSDLSLVGVAARERFWKDLRLVVFSGARYTMFSRIGRPGVHRTWNPVKLAEPLREIAPHLADQLQQLGPQLQSAMRSKVPGDLPIDGRGDLMRRALIHYGQAGAALVGATFSAEDMESAGLLSQEQCARYTDVESQREAFGLVTAQLRDRFAAELSSEQAQQLRWAALRSAGLVERFDSDPPALGGPAQSDHRLVEVEPVAIYW